MPCGLVATVTARLSTSDGEEAVVVDIDALAAVTGEEIEPNADHADAAVVMERIAAAGGSTAMVVCMHDVATAVIEAHGDPEARTAAAAGRHPTTLAYSERGSRKAFWAPLSTAQAVDGQIRLDASKSWATSAGEADSYVWPSRPVDADGASMVWLVPAETAELKVEGPFNGLGLRANASCPISALDAIAAFADLLFTMSYDDPELRPLLEHEGLRRWVPARTDGYRALEAAVDLAGFYDEHGAITATGYAY